MSRISVRLSKSQQELLDLLVAETDTPISEHIRRALDRYFDTFQTHQTERLGALQAGLNHVSYVSVITSFVLLAMAEESDSALVAKAVEDGRAYARAQGIPVPETVPDSDEGDALPASESRAAWQSSAAVPATIATLANMRSSGPARVAGNRTLKARPRATGGHS
jgi:Arc/MetJ-type ribon-helix-helix transcriptional regulator